MIKKLLNKIATNYIFDYILVKKRVNYPGIKIYCIGDSHVSVFSGLGTKYNPYMVPILPKRAKVNLSYFIPIRLGSVLAYNSYRYAKKIEKLLKLKSLNFNKSKDYVLLSFGEIDIRVHILKQSKLQNKSLKQIIKLTISRYYNLISYLYSHGYKIIIYGPIASAKESVIVERFSSYGSCKDRNKATDEFTRQLIELTKQYNIPFITIFYEMIDENYETKDSFLMDNIHLSSNFLFMIINLLKKHNILKER